MHFEGKHTNSTRILGEYITRNEYALLVNVKVKLNYSTFFLNFRKWLTKILFEEEDEE